jgi:hypothetical protein
MKSADNLFDKHQIRDCCNETPVDTAILLYCVWALTELGVPNSAIYVFTPINYATPVRVQVR